MGNLREEQRLLKLMPPAFKDKCPCCGVEWHFETVEIYGARQSIECKQNCFNFCRTQVFPASQMETAWGKLWRSFCWKFGIAEALKLCDEKLYNAAQICNPSEEVFSKILVKVEEAKSLHPTSGMVPSVFHARKMDGSCHIGVNFQPVGTIPGLTFHYDHGAGIHKNTDATVIWTQ